MSTEKIVNFFLQFLESILKLLWILKRSIRMSIVFSEENKENRLREKSVRPVHGKAVLGLSREINTQAHANFTPELTKKRKVVTFEKSLCQQSNSDSPWAKIRDLDEQLNWQDRVEVITKEDHLLIIQLAQFIVEELVNKVVIYCEEDIKSMDSDEDDFNSLPVKPRGATVVNVPADNIKDEDEFDALPVKPRGGGALMPAEDPFDNIPIKVRGGGNVNIPTDNSSNEINVPEANNENEDKFNSLPVKPRGGSSALNDKDDGIVTENQEVVLKSKSSKGVTFDLNETADSNLPPSGELSLNDTDSGLCSQNSSAVGNIIQDFSYDLDAQFKSADSAEFMEDLSFLEQCGENDDEAAQRQAELSRKSLYVRFDPLIGSDSPDKPADSTVTSQHISNSLTSADLFARDSPSTSELAAKLAAVKKSAGIDTSKKSFVENTDDPFSPKKISMVTNSEPPETGVVKKQSPLSDISSNGLVEPLLYTQSDLDEVVRARESDWQKKYDELECKIKEEIAMRELLEQDHREKMECLRKENVDMKQVVAQYEKTIVELTDFAVDFLLKIWQFDLTCPLVIKFASQSHV
ncbi:uncharacterized protein LOC130644921 isoform X2 [Hydractinia symbiolongicarpus]|uniref:uncharacterized protein LOC130644921 isoform X2 n=1 Tax=Hydractinia symbiolongicarpus TaxID=13093 RepID=UPI00254D348C|nr:uncharacterized protein LOC130644921 isoform X2 [Hydractinia symbiolongicarpus]